MIYAVNKRTKEHILHGAPSLADVACCPGWDYIQADADGWIEWNGGECPLPDDKPYKTKHKSGDVFTGSRPQTFSAHWMGYADPVIAYRPIIDQPTNDEPKGWDGVGLPPVGEKILVRKNDNDWLTVEVVAHDDGGVIYRDPATTDHGYKWAIAGGIRPLPSHRDQWVEAARKAIKGSLNGKTGLEIIYDAMIDGNLPTPEKTK